MKFIKLTREDGISIEVRADQVSAIAQCGEKGATVYLPCGAIDVRESPAEIRKQIPQK